MGDRTDFICYLNDDDRKVEAYVEIIDINESFVNFKTFNSEITIPISRVLKIKRRVEDEN